MVLKKRRGTSKHCNVQYYAGYYRDTVTACLDIYIKSRGPKGTRVLDKRMVNAWPCIPYTRLNVLGGKREISNSQFLFAIMTIDIRRGRIKRGFEFFEKSHFHHFKTNTQRNHADTAITRVPQTVSKVYTVSPDNHCLTREEYTEYTLLLKNISVTFVIFRESRQK